MVDSGMGAELSTVECVRYVQFKVVQFEPILEADKEGFSSVLVHFQKRQ